MITLRIYQRLNSRRFECYGSMIEHAKEIAEVGTEVYTHGKILPSIDPKSRRIVLMVFIKLGLITHAGNRRRKKHYQNTPLLFEFIEYCKKLEEIYA